MKTIKYLVLNLTLFLSLISLPGFAHGHTRATEQRLVVSFYSICCGIDTKAKEDLDKLIQRYEKSTRKKLTKSAVRWGKEGEIDYCFKLSELGPKEQKRFISKVRTLLKKSKQVHINENVACQNEP